MKRALLLSLIFLYASISGPNAWAADQKISQMPSGGLIGTSDMVPVVRSGSNYRVGVGSMAAETAADYCKLSGANAFTNSNTISVNSSSAPLRLTQTGSGNALEVEDSSTPDSTPFVVDNAGNVGIGTAPDTSFKVDMLGVGMLAGDSRTDSTNKNWRLHVPAYLNSNGNFVPLFISGSSGVNRVNIGGGTGTGNAATEMRVYTAANTNTSTGSVRLTIDNAGDIFTPAGGLIRVLARTNSIDAKTVAATNLYTVPTGKTAIITGAIIRVTAASSISAGPTLGIGVAAGESDMFASISLSTLTTTANIYGFALVGASVPATAGQIIKVGIDTGSTGTSQTISIDLLGYLI